MMVRAQVDTAPKRHGHEPWPDLRALIRALEDRGKLYRVKKEVDAAWEIAAMARWVYQGFPEDQRFALLFEHVKGTTVPVVTPLIGASRDIYAVAMGTTADGIHETWLHALRHPVTPVTVSNGCSQEKVIPRQAVDLGTIPVPIWTPGKDSKPTITACVITRDRQTRVQNMGTYRCQVQSRNRVTLNTRPGRQAYQNYESFASHGQPAPIAVAIGCEPAVHLATSAALPKGVDEITVAGGLKGSPIETVRAKTVDLEVPARAEIIVEGELHPTDRMLEAPFGEFAGYMTPESRPRPVFEVTCITHRTDPVYYGYVSQFPPSESTMLQGQANESVTHAMLVDYFGETTVTDVAINQTHGGLLGHVVVQMTPRYPGHGKKVGRLVAETTHLKLVSVVDVDVDIRFQQHLDMVLSSRVNPARDVVIIDGFNIPIDPSSEDGLTSKLVMDATQKGAQPDISLPSKAILWRALESWRAAGLPSFEPPRRIERLLDVHETRLKSERKS